MIFLFFPRFRLRFCLFRASRSDGVSGFLARLMKRGCSNRRSKRREYTEKLLREEWEFSRNLIHFPAVPAFVIDSRHRVLIWNRAREELTGIRADDVAHWKAFYEKQRPCLADIIIENSVEELVS